MRYHRHGGVVAAFVTAQLDVDVGQGLVELSGAGRARCNNWHLLEGEVGPVTLALFIVIW